MANGVLAAGQAPHYEDYASLKKWIRSRQDLYVTRDLELKRFIFNQTGTGSFVEIEDKGTETIADIGKATVTLELASAVDEASHNGVVFTITWVDSAGNSFTSEATGTAGLATTPVAFATPVTTSVYAVTSFTASADFANQDVLAMVNAGATYATISAAGTTLAATEAQLVGVGKVMAQTMVDDATQHGKEVYLNYITPWGTEKYALATLDGADSSTEVVFYEASSAYVATTVLVKDFYRRRFLMSELASVATKEIGVVAVGGAAIYAIIGALQHQSMHSRFTVRASHSAWLARIVWTSTVATNLVTQLKITFTPYGDTDEHNIIITNGAFLSVDPCIRFASNTDIKFEVLGNLTNNTFNLHMLDVENR